MLNWKTFLLTLGVACTLAASPAFAQPYPTRPIKLVVPFPPGGATDSSARLIAQALGERLGQRVVVENKPGASTRIATEYVVRSAPDGYTLLYSPTALSTNAALYTAETLKYDVLKDLTPIVHIADYPYALLVRGSLEAKNLKELVALAKARPGKLTIATAGGATMPNLAAELFTRSFGLDLLAVPYKGTGGVIPDMLAERIDMYFEGRTVAAGHIDAGTIKALAFAWPQRAPNLPNVPTFKEEGYATFEVAAWFGMMAPAGTPPEIVKRLNEVVVAEVRNPELHNRLVAMDLIPSGTTPEEFGRIIRDTTIKWAKIIKDAGITP
jgi:tripartite-type tricarboxylate transporter receptor subunit TctC